ncbi:MAG: transcriptional repressor [Syntrophobacterales bacterium]|nr:transcriptional repressor [Syntrophobacterales bacterium]
MRVTIQRKTILETLRRLKSHPTAEELYSIIKPSLPRISLATVYRNLELLAEEGLIRKIFVQGSSQKRFDGNPHPHCHIQCINCGKVDDITINPILNPIKFIMETKGFEVTNYHIEFSGLCADCKKQPSQKEETKNGRKKCKGNKN